MKTSFDPKNKTWLRKTTDRLPLHDLYFGTPLNRPTAGIPVGDGDTGSLIWLHKDGLHVNIGKSDLWQDAPKGVRPGEDWYNTNNEELHTLNKHGGEIVINFDCPLFDYMYQESFEKRLSLSDATVYFLGARCARLYGKFLDVSAISKQIKKIELCDRTSAYISVANKHYSMLISHI